MNWKSEITELLKVAYPLIQAPMAGFSTVEMAAAASNAGCLGSLGFGNNAPDKCLADIRKLKQLSGKPFAANIFLNDVPEVNDELIKRYNNSKAFIEQFALENGVEAHLPGLEEIRLTDYREQLEVIISENCPVLSFTFGNLDDNSIARLKSKGIILAGTCTSVEEAKLLENSGIDIICVQGWEAGGHRGSFESEEIPEIGGMSLLSNVYETVKTPLIYAGGIRNGKTLLASKMLGAKGFQLGSIFLCSEESALTAAEKQKLQSVTEKDIVVSKSFSGRYARGINNRFIRHLAENPVHILPYPFQNKLTAEMRAVAKKSGNLDFVSIWCGQSAYEYPEKSTGLILKDLVAETEKLKVKS